MGGQDRRVLRELNEAVAGSGELDALVAERVAAITGNSRAALAAIKDLYNLAQGELGIDEALDEEGKRTYEEIQDTAERLTGF